MNTHKPFKGCFLISEPFLPDPNFKRKVIYLTEHNDEGSIGFVLNNPLNIDVETVADNLPDCKHPLYQGGPVELDTLHYIHTLGEQIKNSQEINKGIYWGGEFDDLKSLLAKKEFSANEIKFFIGYSGWGKGQLQAEINEKSWIVSSALSKFIFSNEDNLWKKVLQSMGQKYEIVAGFPDDPSLN